MGKTRKRTTHNTGKNGKPDLQKLSKVKVGVRSQSQDPQLSQSYKIHNEPILRDPQQANPTQQQSIRGPSHIQQKSYSFGKSQEVGSAGAFLYLPKPSRGPRVSPHQSHDG